LRRLTRIQVGIKREFGDGRSGTVCCRRYNVNESLRSSLKPTRISDQEDTTRVDKLAGLVNNLSLLCQGSIKIVVKGEVKEEVRKESNSLDNQCENVKSQTIPSEEACRSSQDTKSVTRH
jgi:hypothetical protein